MRWMVSIALSLLLFGISPSAGTAASTFKDMGAETIDLMNATRARKGKAPLVISRKLTRAATAHARDMARKRFFSHSGSDGSNVGTRAKRQNYGYCLVAENIAKGHRTKNEVLRGWMNSRGHRRNILRSSATEFGLVRGPGNIWVMVVGRPGC